MVAFCTEFNLLTPFYFLFSYMIMDLPVNGDLVCSIFDKRDAFHFVNFPDLSENILTAPAYGTYISQLIRYRLACHNYDIFLSTSHACRKTFQPRFFCEKTDENSLQIYGQISRTCIKVKQESIINDT